MSWWIYLGKKEPVEVNNHSEGGTYAIGGIRRAELNITYNYSKFFYEKLDKENGLMWLHDRRAKDCIFRLIKAIKELGIDKSIDYWALTPGNAGYALNILLEWAKKHPLAKFVVH